MKASVDRLIKSKKYYHIQKVKDEKFQKAQEIGKRPPYGLMRKEELDNENKSRDIEK